MSSLQDTPQQALAGWLHQRGGEKAIELMAHDLDVAPSYVGHVMDSQSKYGDFTSRAFAAALALYTDGEVIFPSCPDWAVEKVRGLSHG